MIHCDDADHGCDIFVVRPCVRHRGDILCYAGLQQDPTPIFECVFHEGIPYSTNYPHMDTMFTTAHSISVAKPICDYVLRPGLCSEASDSPPPVVAQNER